MGRKIGEGVKNELVIRDPISGSEIVLYYRVPTSSERVAYMSSLFERKEDRVISRITEARQEWGLKIIEGFRDGAFEKMNGDGFIQMSSNPKSKNYDKGWKDHLKIYASDILEALSEHIFEGHRVSSMQSKEERFTEKNS